MRVTAQGSEREPEPERERSSDDLDGTVDSYGSPFWIAVVVGSSVMAWGVRLFLEAVPDLGERVNFVVFVVGSDVVHDGLIAPMVCAVGVLVASAAPPWLRAPLQSALVASGVVLLLAWLPLRGTADAVGNPSIQPLDYVTATASVLAAVWLAASAWAWYRWRS